MAHKLKGLLVHEHSSAETLIHRSVWILCIVKICHSVYVTSHGLDSRQIKDFVQDGWNIFGKKQDISDADWIYWKKIFIYLWPWFVIHVLLGLILRLLSAHGIRKVIFIIYTIIFLISFLGPVLTTFYLAKVICLSVIARVTKSPAIIWSISLTFLSTLAFPNLRNIMIGFGLFYTNGDIRFYFQEYLLTMGFLRYTGCALFIASDDDNEEVKQDLSLNSKSNFFENKNIRWEWTDILCYNLYFPCSIFGPFLTFKDFHFQFSQEHKTYSRDILSEIIRKVIKCCLWCTVIEVSNHFLYYSAMKYNQDLMKSMSLWSLAGVGYICGQMFMVKYFVLWTGISIFTSIDRINIPEPPSCISRIYAYSDMWKMFDKGLYQFLKWHIYIPIGGNRRGRVRRHVASCLSFAFILFWHGVSNVIIVWIFVNFASLIFEEILSASSLIFEKLKISPSWSRRIHSMVNIPLLGLSTFGTFVFLVGLEPASVIARRILTEAEYPTSLVLVSITGYCMIQTGKDCENYLHRKSKEFIK